MYYAFYAPYTLLYICIYNILYIIHIYSINKCMYIISGQDTVKQVLPSISLLTPTTVISDIELLLMDTHFNVCRSVAVTRHGILLP